VRVVELDPGSGGLIAVALAKARAADPPRRGVHVGTVVQDMLRAMEPKKYQSEMADATKHTIWELGNSVEDMLASQMVLRWPGWEKPQPRVVRGLTGSPDGYSKRSRTIDEIKATWKSQARFLETLKWHGYVMQALTYAYMWEAVRLRVSVVFMSYPQPPHTYVVRFSRAEARQQFEQVRQHAVDVGWLKAA